MISTVGHRKVSVKPSFGSHACLAYQIKGGLSPFVALGFHRDRLVFGGASTFPLCKDVCTQREVRQYPRSPSRVSSQRRIKRSTSCCPRIEQAFNH